MSVLEKQWPFMRGLDDSLSDSTMTSSGDAGCRSLFTSLRGENDPVEDLSHHDRLNNAQTAVNFCGSASRPVGGGVKQMTSPTRRGANVCWDTQEDKSQEINNGVMAAQGRSQPAITWRHTTHTSCPLPRHRHGRPRQHANHRAAVCFFLQKKRLKAFDKTLSGFS